MFAESLRYDTMSFSLSRSVVAKPNFTNHPRFTIRLVKDKAAASSPLINHWYTVIYEFTGVDPVCKCHCPLCLPFCPNSLCCDREIFIEAGEHRGVRTLVRLALGLFDAPWLQPRVFRICHVVLGQCVPLMNIDVHWKDGILGNAVHLKLEVERVGCWNGFKHVETRSSMPRTCPKDGHWPPGHKAQQGQQRARATDKPKPGSDGDEYRQKGQ